MPTAIPRRPPRRALRGFATHDPLVPLAMILIIGGIAFFQFRSYTRAAQMTERLKADVVTWQRAEHAWRSTHGAYTASAESLGVTLTGGARVMSARGDSLGWAVVLVNDSLGLKHPSACSMHEGRRDYAPNRTQRDPGVVTCWKPD